MVFEEAKLSVDQITHTHLYMLMSHLYHAHNSLWMGFAETIKPLFKSITTNQNVLLLLSYKQEMTSWVQIKLAWCGFKENWGMETEGKATGSYRGHQIVGNMGWIWLQ